MTTRRRTRKESYEDPVWAILQEQGRSIRWLARTAGYSESHLLGVKIGWQQPSDHLREACARVLQLPASLLFLPRTSKSCSRNRGGAI